MPYCIAMGRWTAGPRGKDVHGWWWTGDVLGGRGGPSKGGRVLEFGGYDHTKERKS